MSLTVEALNRTTIGSSSMADFIKEQLLIIDRMIQRSDKSMGENTLRYSMPMIFPGIPTDYDVSKTIVYAKIIKSLEKRGFVCKLNIDKKTDKTDLYIKWTVFIDPEELNDLKKYLSTKLT